MNRADGPEAKAPLNRNRGNGPVRIGAWHVDPDLDRISCSGTEVLLEPKTMAVLMYLAARPGQVVSADELIEAVWLGRPMGDNPVYNCITRLRKAFGDNSRSPAYIATIPKKGYILIAPVSAAGHHAEANYTRAGNRKEHSPRRPLRVAGQGLRAGIVALLAGVVFLSAWFTWRGEGEILSSENRLMLAVLPFENLSDDPGQEYFSDGLTEEIINRLGRLSPDSLGVIAPTSVMRYKQTQMSHFEIGRELGVNILLAGRLHESGKRIGLSLELVDIARRKRLWAADYDAEIADVLMLERKITENVATALMVDRNAGEQTLIGKQPTMSPDAYLEYLKGQHFLGKWDELAFANARDHFQRALDLDPTFARAWSGLSDAYDHLADSAGLAAHEAYPRARAAAERALALDPDLAQARASLANTLASYYWKSEAAEWHFRRALELDPNYARSYRTYARHLRNLGRFEEALVETRKAQELDPLLAASHIEEAIIHYMAGRYDEAIAKYQSVLVAVPDSVLTHNGLALNYTQLGRYHDALTALDRAAQHGVHVNSLAIRGVVYAMAGRPADARRILIALDQLAQEKPVSSFHKAAIQVHLGEHGLAFDLLEEAVGERTSYLRLLKVDPIFDPLRPDPRFSELLIQVGLEG